jgi:hypothetical protein
VRAARLRAIPRSRKVAEVMPALVAARAAPRKTLVSVLSPGPDPGQEGEDDAGAADGERDPPDRPHLREPRLQPDPEEQEDDAELGEDAQHLVDLDQPQDRGPDQDAAEDLADDRRLVDPLEELVAELGGQ